MQKVGFKATRGSEAPENSEAAEVIKINSNSHRHQLPGYVVAGPKLGDKTSSRVAH